MPSASSPGLKLVSIHQTEGPATLGVCTPFGVLDVRAASESLTMPGPRTLEQMIREGTQDEVRALAIYATAAGRSGLFLDETTITHGRLFNTPDKIICVGLNYRGHAAEVGAPIPRVPPLFNKLRNALAAHGTRIQLPPASIATQFDYETELVIVMGRAARDVDESDALDYVAGYCVGNDFSARDLQLQLPGAQWLVGKSLDGFAPIGPYFVSAECVPNPDALSVTTRVNGELRQDSCTSDFIFKTRQLIAYISRYWTLLPGDLIFTGTPQGVILGYPEHQRRWLAAGDEIECTIEGLGTLKFSLGA